MLSQVLEANDKMGHRLHGFLCDRVELTHQFSLGNVSTKQLDKLFAELIEIVELCDVVLQVPTHCLPVQRYHELSYLGDVSLGHCEEFGGMVRLPCSKVCVDVCFRVGLAVVAMIRVRHGVFLEIVEKLRR